MPNLNEDLETLRSVLSMLLTAKSYIDSVSSNPPASKKNLDKTKKEIISAQNRILKEIERLKNG